MMWLHKLVMQNSYSPNGKSFYTSAAFKRVHMVIETHFAKRQINLGLHMFCVSFMWFLSKIFYWKLSQCKKIIMWRKTHSSSSPHKNQDLTIFFWERHKKVNNLFIAIEFTIQESKRYCKGKYYIMQTLQTWGGHTFHFTAEDNSFLIWV